MRVRLIETTTLASGLRSRRERALEVEALRIGRGTHNEIVVNDLAVPLEQARVQATPEGPRIEDASGLGVLVNGRPSRAALLRPGDRVRVGGCELRVLDPGPGEELALEIEARERRPSELEALRARTRLRLERGLLDRRRLSWLALAGGLVLLVLAPLGSQRFERIWSSGEISRSHAFIAHQCSQCHTQPFVGVADGVCLTCHAEVGAHAPAVRAAATQAMPCRSCHAEHNGARGLAALHSGLCSGCHGPDGSAVRADGPGPASDFGRLHPPFRLQLVDPATGSARRVAWAPGLEERSGLRFNHLRHVGRLVADRETGEKRHMRCGECHRVAPDGGRMQALRFERDCQRCHGLSFDTRLPERQALHGDPAAMRANLLEIYAAWVLQGGAREESAPPAVRRARPGVALGEGERREVRRWVEAQVRAADERLMQREGKCATCHELRPGAAADGGTGIAPVALPEAWLSKARFSHARHAPFACRTCHPAAAVYDPGPTERGPRPDWSLPEARPYGLVSREVLRREHGVEPSERAEDILIPDLEGCRRCHGGARARPPKVASECVLCHGFHRSELGPLRKASHGRRLATLPSGEGDGSR